MSRPEQALELGASFALAIDKLVELEGTVHPDLRVYSWRPPALPQVPALWNWALPSPAEQIDLDTWEDTFRIKAVVGVRADVAEQMPHLAIYADHFRKVVDAALHRNPTLDGACHRATRESMSTGVDVFGEIPVLTMEFGLRLVLARHIPPNSQP